MAIDPKITSMALRETSNESTQLHGSRSGGLIEFHESSPVSQRASLPPMGARRESGAPVLSGERGNSLHENAFNSQHLSVVDERQVDGAIDDAKDQDAARQSPVVASGPGDPFAGTAGAKDEIANKALETPKASGPGMYALVSQNLPVLYGVKPDPSRIAGTPSSIQGEAAIRGGVSANEIGAIFVPGEHVADVQALMQKSGKAIPVHPMSAHEPD